MPHRCWSRRIDDLECYLHSPLREKEQQDPHAVEQLAAWVDMLGSSQMAIRSDGEPAVMQAAAAVRDARRAGSVTTLGDICARWIMLEMVLAERAVGLVGVQLPNADTTRIEDHCLDDCARDHLAEPGHSWA